MNWFDIVLALLILASFLSGLAKGFSRSAIGFVTFLAAIGCALWFYVPAGFWFRSFVHSRPLAHVAGFVAVFIAVSILGAFVERAVRQFVEVTDLTWLDRILGGAAGAVQGFLTATVLVLIVFAFAPRPVVDPIRSSAMLPYLTGAARMVATAAPDEVKSGFQSARNDLEEALPQPMKKGVEKFSANP